MPAGSASPEKSFLGLGKKRLGNGAIAAILFFALVAVFNSNLTLMEEGDAVPNVNLPLTLLDRRTLSFSPDDFPDMFSWKSKSPLYETDDFFVRTWQWPIGNKTARQWKDEGYITFEKPHYHTVLSPKRHVYVSAFGPIPGLTFTPLVAVLRALDPAFGINTLLLLSAAKLHAALLVAASCAALYLTSVRYLSQNRALLVAATYGLGTCAWSIASQTIWQQTVTTFLICMGLYNLLQAPLRPRAAALSGLFFGTAAACRPTLALLLLCAIASAYVIEKGVAAPLYVALGAVLPLFAIGFYNAYYFAGPLSFGQEPAGHVVALAKTGSADLWQTPFALGALGLLVSPSRGLLIFTPVAAFGLYGAVLIYRDTRYRAFRPLALGTLGVMAVQCKWFDWWGGWTYGYRPWLDALPVLVLCLLPVFAEKPRTRTEINIFRALLAWSIFVQFIGAFTYDKSWNARRLYVVLPPHVIPAVGLYSESDAFEFSNQTGGEYLGATGCNIDLTYCRYRLWSLRDCMIAYYVGSFRETRRRRFPTAWRALAPLRGL